MTASGRFPGQAKDAPKAELDPQRGRMVSQPKAPSAPAAPGPRRERVTVTNHADDARSTGTRRREQAPRVTGFVVRTF
jgi:hypothetical protein